MSHSFRLLTLTSAFLLTMTACQSNADTKASDASEALSATPASAARPPLAEGKVQANASSDKKEHAAGTFGAIVSNPTALTVTQMRPDEIVNFRGKLRKTTDADMLTKFTQAVGDDVVGTSAIPKCLPNYTFSFTPQDALAPVQFSGVCAGTKSVILVHKSKAYVAKDPAGVQALLKALAATPAP